MTPPPIEVSGTVMVNFVAASLMVSGLPQLLAKENLICNKSVLMRVVDVETKKAYLVCLESKKEFSFILNRKKDDR